jgi:hypothetical protein
MASTRKSKSVVKTGKAHGRSISGTTVSKLKKAGSFESARIAQQHLKRAS